MILDGRMFITLYWQVMLLIVQDLLNYWNPPRSGVREEIKTIHKKHLEGFTRNLKTVKDKLSVMTKREELREDDGTAALDLAELELRNYETFQHSRKNLRAALTRMDTLSKKIDDFIINVWPTKWMW